MITLLIKALRDVQRRPLRTLLTVIGITLGVAGLVAINHTGHNLADAQRETYAGARQPDFTLFVSQISPTLLNLVARQDNVETVDTRMVRTTRTSAGDSWLTTRLVGVEDFFNIRLSELQLVEGRYPGRAEVVYDIGAQELLGLEVGDTVALQRTGGAPMHYLQVSGFVQVPEALDPTVANRATAFVPAVEARRFEGRQYNNFLMVRLEDPRQASDTASSISRLLNRRGIGTGAPSIRDPDVYTGSRELETLLVLLQVFSVIGLALSGFLVVNTVAAIMVEETRQIGIIKAVGGSSWSMLVGYLGFAMLIGLAASLLGLGAGLIGGRLLTTYLAGLSGLFLPGFAIDWTDIALAFGVGVGVAVVSALVPTWMNTRRRIAELLQNIGVVADFRRGIVHRLTTLAARFGSIFAMGIRNVSRRPARAAITIIVVAVAVSAFLGTEAVNRSVTTTVDNLYDLYGGEAWVSFEQPIDMGFARRLERHEDVVRAEPWTRSSGSINATSTTIWGMPEDTQIYTARLTEGTWLQRGNPPGAVLTVNLAEEIDAKVGDILTLDMQGEGNLIQVVGLVDDESTFLGADAIGKVFLRIEDQQRLLGRGQQAGIFALQLTSSSPDNVDRILADIEETFAVYQPQTVPMYQDQESARRVIGILTLMLNAMVAIVGLVGLAGIVNTLVINMTERRREFGILRSIGASRRQLVSLLVTEGVALATLGYALGLLLGYPLARYLVELTGQALFDLEFQFSSVAFVGSFFVALFASAAVALGPALVASRIRPIQVLRYE
ncbi:MAG: FtsX-like permease family protein [Thermomicrobiaceae bacterium]